MSAATNEGNPDEGPVYHGAGGLAHIGDRVFLNSTNNEEEDYVVSSLPEKVRFLQCLILLMIVKQCTHL